MQITGIEIRAARKSELGSVSRLMRDTIMGLQYYNAAARRAFVKEVGRGNLSHYLKADKNSITVAASGKKVLGVITAVPDHSLLWLDWLIVDEDHRNRNIGTELVRHVLESARQRNVKKVWCDSRASNKEGIRILRKMGFSAVCKLKGHWYGQDYVLWERFT